MLFIVCLGVLAALIGFMKVNWNPAKMYMGDNGSQFLGALLAIVGIIVFWNGSTIFAAFLHTYLFNRAAKYKIKKANQTGDLV